jgi:hypothetical protein
MTPALGHDWFDRPLPDNVRIGAGSWLHSSYAFLHNRSRRPCALSVGRNSGIYGAASSSWDRKERSASAITARSSASSSRATARC